MPILNVRAKTQRRTIMEADFREVQKALKEDEKRTKKLAKKIDETFEVRDNRELYEMAEAGTLNDEMMADGTLDAETEAYNFDKYMKEDSKAEAKAIRRIVRAVDRDINKSLKEGEEEDEE